MVFLDGKNEADCARGVARNATTYLNGIGKDDDLMEVSIRLSLHGASSPLTIRRARVCSRTAVCEYLGEYAILSGYWIFDKKRIF